MGKYWDNVCQMQQKQTNKGIEKYGQVLEQNSTLTPIERVTYLQEEMIDGLMYCEHLKEILKDKIQKESADDADLLERLIHERTVENLITCLIEEMSELTKVLCKYERKSDKYSIESLAEELAHVRLMTIAVSERFKISSHTLESYMEDALRRAFK